MQAVDNCLVRVWFIGMMPKTKNVSCIVDSLVTSAHVQYQGERNVPFDRTIPQYKVNDGISKYRRQAFPFTPFYKRSSVNWLLFFVIVVVGDVTLN